MTKKAISTMFMLVLLAVGAKSAWGMEETGSAVKIHGDDYIYVLSEPVDGEFRGSVWDNICMQTTGKTFTDKDGVKWIEVWGVSEGWIEAGNASESADCARVFETLESLYAAMESPAENESDECGFDTFFDTDTDGFREWFETHTGETVVFRHNHARGNVSKTEISRADAMERVLDQLDSIGYYNSEGCDHRSRQAFYGSLIPVVETPGEFMILFDGNLADVSTSAYFKNLSETPVLYQINRTNTYK